MIRRVLVGNTTAIRHTVYVDETETAAAAPLTVTVTREDGTSLTGGASTLVTDTVGTYTFSLTAATHANRVDDLVVTWSGTVGGNTYSRTEIYRVVGAHLFETVALRRFDELTEFTVAELELARDLVAENIDDFTQAAWVPRYAREVRDGQDTYLSQVDPHLPSSVAQRTVFTSKTPLRSLISVKVGGVTQTLGNFTTKASGRIVWTTGVFPYTLGGQNVEVQYEYGHRLPDLHLRDAALKWARHILSTVDPAVPDRARLLTTEWGTFQLTMAGDEYPTGIPDVDSVLRRKREIPPVMFA